MQAPRTSIMHISVTLATLFCAVTLTGCGSSNAADAPLKPTSVVLVHGAWADGASWNKVIAVLQKNGLKVTAVQLPRATLADDAATVRRTVDAQTGQVVLVGHSYGGAVITQGGTGVKVAALVYVSAFAPGDGQSINDLLAPYPAAPWQATLEVDSGGYLRLSDAAVKGSFAQDLPAADAALLAVTQGPIFNHVLADKVDVAAWKAKPTWWINGSADMIIPPALQKVEAARMGAKTTVIDGASHVALISHSDEVAAVILDAVRGVGGL